MYVYTLLIHVLCTAVCGTAYASGGLILIPPTDRMYQYP